jgi:ABC-type Fe3+/spermidine/putrescine transport system ATPase subunit
MDAASERGRLEVTELGVQLGGFALRDVSLRCEPGEYHVLIGPTGCGKSTAVKCLLGLHAKSSGRILLGGDDLSAAPPERRRMGYVPQSHALFPHIDVEGNIRFGIRAGRNGAAADAALLERLVDLLDIRSLLTRRVGQLSGGERQKVALARALGAQPELVLLDEPFSALDEGSRRRLWLELRAVFAELGTTVIHITHSLEEASAMGDRVSVMLDGRVVQQGPVRAVLERPASPAVAAFLGYRNLYEGVASCVAGEGRIALEGVEIRTTQPLPVTGRVTLCVRPQDVRIVEDGRPLQPAIAGNVLAGRLVQLMTLSDSCVALVLLGATSRPLQLELRFPVHLQRRFALREGQDIRVGLYEPGLLVYPQAGVSSGST